MHESLQVWPSGAQWVMAQEHHISRVVMKWPCDIVTGLVQHWKTFRSYHLHNAGRRSANEHVVGKSLHRYVPGMSMIEEG
jgi:hypothetical protein